MLSNVLFVGALIALAAVCIVFLTLLLMNKQVRNITLILGGILVVAILLSSCASYSCPTYSGAYKAQEVKAFTRR
jgi:cobalamin biosynthesis protein CobD/CbiB